MLTAADYIEATEGTDLYMGRPYELLTCYILGLNEEAGEAAGKLKKYMRGDYENPEWVGEDAEEAWEKFRHDMLLELGDVLWYNSRILSLLETSFEEVMQMNLDKLSSRAQRGTLRGNGDDR